MPAAGARPGSDNSPTQRSQIVLMNGHASSEGDSQAKERSNPAGTTEIKTLKKRDLKKMEKEKKKLMAQDAILNGVTVIPPKELLKDDGLGRESEAPEAASAAEKCHLLADPYDIQLCDEKERDGCLICPKVREFVAVLEARHESEMASVEAHQTQLLAYVRAKREEDQDLLDARREELLEQASKARMEELKVRLADAKAAAERKQEEVHATQRKLEETLEALEALEAEDVS